MSTVPKKAVVNLNNFINAISPRHFWLQKDEHDAKNEKSATKNTLQKPMQKLTGDALKRTCFDELNAKLAV